MVFGSSSVTSLGQCRIQVEVYRLVISMLSPCKEFVHALCAQHEKVVITSKAMQQCGPGGNPAVWDTIFDRYAAAASTDRIQETHHIDFGGRWLVAL